MKNKMIETQLQGRDIYDYKVLGALHDVDRELFVPPHIRHMAYEDTPLPIGRGQTISQPYIVAYMAQVLDLEPEDKVLEIGTGSGYQAAVLSRLVNHVYSIEIFGRLARQARQNLDAAAVRNVSIAHGNGMKGWPQEAPFDKILLTAAVTQIPDALKQQLKVGGKILAPVTHNFQKLILLEKISEDVFEEYDLIYVSFVPMSA